VVPRRKLPSPSAACIPLSGTATWGREGEVHCMSRDQRQLLRLIKNLLPVEVAIDDASIAGRFGVSMADVRQVIRIGRRSRRLDVIVGYVCLPAGAAERRSAA
jgi:hypothetical protein